MDTDWVICPFVWEPPDRFALLGDNFSQIFEECAPSLAGIAAQLEPEQRVEFWAAVPKLGTTEGVWQWRGQRLQGEAIVQIGLRADWGGTAWHGAFWSDGGRSRRLAQRHQTLSQILQRWQEGARLRQRLLAAMSHEIRAPLTSAIGLLELLSQQPLSASQQELVQMLTLCHRELMQVVHGVLDYSKLEIESDAESEQTVFDVLACLEDTVDLLTVQARSKNLALTWEGPPEPLPLVWGTQEPLRQVLVNLVGNAVKYTEQGSVVLSVAVESQDDRYLWLRFAVRDTGPGIPPEHQERIFEPFVRLDTQQRGTGLGLALCQKMVARMGGTLTVDSTVGQGSCFAFTLPLRRGPWPEVPCYPWPVLVVSARADWAQRLMTLVAPWQTTVTVVSTGREAIAHLMENSYRLALMDWALPDTTGELLAMQMARRWPQVWRAVVGDLPDRAQHTLGLVFHHRLTEPLRRSRLQACWQLGEAPLAGPSPAVAASGPRGRVLVVDDNAGNLLVFQAQLASLGYEVLTATNGREALSLLTHQSIDLVFMDCQMPVMNGFEATRLWRQHEAQQKSGRRVPIVAITAGMFAEDRERCLAAGMDDFLLKPVNRAALQAAGERWLRPASPEA